MKKKIVIFLQPPDSLFDLGNTVVWEEIFIIAVLLETPFIGDPPHFQWRPHIFKGDSHIFNGDPIFSPMRIWGSPMRIKGSSTKYGVSNENMGISIENLGSPMKIFEVQGKCWVSNKNVGPPMKKGGLQWKYWGSNENLGGVSNENIRVSNNNPWVFNETSMGFSNEMGSPIVLQYILTRDFLHFKYSCNSWNAEQLEGKG